METTKGQQKTKKREAQNLVQQYLESVGEMLGCLVLDEHSDLDEFLGAAVAKEHLAAEPEAKDGRFPSWAN